MARIVILRSRSTGGIEPRVERVARALRKKGHEVRVFLWDREEAYPRAETRDGIQVQRIPLPAPYNRPILVIPILWWTLAAFWATRGADIVHACDLDTLPAALAAKALRRSRIVYDIFDFYGHMITWRLRDSTRAGLTHLEAMLASLSDLVLLPDAARRDGLGEDFPRHVEVIMNTPSDTVLQAPKAEGFILFYGGNLAPDRGLLETIEALHDLEGIEFRIAGAGQLTEAIRNLEAVTDNLKFLGQLDHSRVLEETSRATALIAWYDPTVPANRVASPNKLFEGMMLSRPILVSAGTRMADIVEKEGCGLVVPYDDSNALREAVGHIKDNPAQARVLGRRGREAFEREYNWGVNEIRLHRVYERVLS